MRRLTTRVLCAILPGVMLGLLLTGCGGKKQDDDDAPVKSSKVKRTGGGSTAAKSNLQPVKATEYGVIRGKVTWSGPKPDIDAETTKLQASMVTNKDYCLSGKDYEKNWQVYRIGANDGLGNVFVWLVPEKDHYFEIPADQLAKFKNDLVVISQPHCAFLPHASVLFPYYIKDGKQEPTGQKLKVLNDATVSHNSKVEGSKAFNPERNQTLSPGTDMEYVLKPDRSPITVSCGIHGWMSAYLRAFDHPYAAVTSVGRDVKAKLFEDPKSPKYGTYEIVGVPVGAKVRIVAWHEDKGYLAGDTGRELTIQKQNPDVNFEASK